MEATTRIIDLTVAELMAIIRKEMEPLTKATITVHSETPEKPAEQPLYGIEGIAQALHCSRTKAIRLKKEGMLEGGYQQIGKSIIVRSAQTLRDIAELSLKKGRKKRTATHK